MQRDRQAGRDRNTDTDRDTEKHLVRVNVTLLNISTHWVRQTYRWTDSGKYRSRHREAEREVQKQTQRRTKSFTGRKVTRRGIDCPGM